VKPDNIIPINKPMIDALNRMLDLLDKNQWKGPESFNAILVDRKNFMRMLQIKNPAPPSIRIPVLAKLPKLSILLGTTVPTESVYEEVEFYFYRRIGETIEYREE
jgi:hypothetical protein